MGLTESQKLLARLSTDATLRSRFASELEVVAAEFGLSLEEAQSLPLAPIDEFARSLIRKRRSEVESLLPLTFRSMGTDRFALLFRRHASKSLPNGVKKHRDDAVAFARFLAQEVIEPPWLGDLARLEASGLLAYDPANRWSWVRLGYDPVDLFQASNEKDLKLKPRPILILWFRLASKGRLLRIVLRRPW